MPHSAIDTEESALGPTRIFVDATYTLCSGKNSGIERVVRSIIRESSQLSVPGALGGRHSREQRQVHQTRHGGGGP